MSANDVFIPKIIKSNRGEKNK